MSVAGDGAPPTDHTPSRVAWLDGLRAVAVLVVVFYHFDLMGMSGGFLGVDVFFVISGFCICSSMMRARARPEGFRIRDFWRNRVLRILPLSIVTMLLVLVAAFFLMHPRDYAATGETVLWQIVFSGNIQQIIAGSDYDSPASLTQPLLHMWSLAVEEQFYLAFPLIMAALWRLTRGGAAGLIAVAVLAVASFAWSVYGTMFFDHAAYYDPFGRAWEILAGALLAMTQARITSVVIAAWKRQLIVALGLAMILGPSVMYSAATVFPGAGALMPVMGTVLIIALSLGGETVAGRLLAFRPLAFLGRISYSFYLWHWPLFVLASYYALYPLDLAARLVLLVVTVGVSALSWRFIEQPFQRPMLRRKGHLQVACGGGAAAAITILVAGIVVHFGGWPDRLPQAIPQADYDAWGRNDTPDGGNPLDTRRYLRSDAVVVLGAAGDDPPAFLIYGDSHARAVREVLGPVASRVGVWGYSAVGGGLLPIQGCEYYSEEGGGTMAACNKEVLDFVLERGIPNVILVGRWDWGYHSNDNMYLTDADHRQPDPASSRLVFEAHVQETVEAFRAHGVQVWVMSQVPKQPYSIPNKISLARRRVGGITLAQHDAMQDPVDAVFRRHGAALIDPRHGLFDETGRSVITIGDTLIYSDDDHVLPVGMALVTPEFERVLEAMKAGMAAAAATPREP